jgi:hypothetical protein
MQAVRVLRVSALTVVVLGMVAGAGGRAGPAVDAQHSQAPGTTAGPPGPPGPIPPLDQPATALPDNPMRGRMEAERMKALNDDRHKRLTADVDRLVELTNELKTDVDKTSKDELSVEVVKKAQEIEKLAHDVQSRMKN